MRNGERKLKNLRNFIKRKYDLRKNKLNEKWKRTHQSNFIVKDLVR